MVTSEKIDGPGFWGRGLFENNCSRTLCRGKQQPVRVEQHSCMRYNCSRAAEFTRAAELYEIKFEIDGGDKVRELLRTQEVLRELR